jgi:hypothetical protein
MTCYTHPDTGIRHCTTAEACAPGSAWDQRTQACSPPPLEALTILGCRVEVIYPASRPQYPTVIVHNSWGCDSAGVELALAVVLARLLGAPR